MCTPSFAVAIPSLKPVRLLKEKTTTTPNKFRSYIEKEGRQGVQSLSHSIAGDGILERCWFARAALDIQSRGQWYVSHKRAAQSISQVSSRRTVPGKFKVRACGTAASWQGLSPRSRTFTASVRDGARSIQQGVIRTIRTGFICAEGSRYGPDDLSSWTSTSLHVGAYARMAGAYQRSLELVQAKAFLSISSWRGLQANEATELSGAAYRRSP